MRGKQPHIMKTETTANITTPPAVIQAPPEFVRLPAPKEHCPWCGLGRSHLNSLIADGSVRSVSLRKKGRARGVRLVYLQSIIDYIKSMEKEAAHA